MPKKGSGQGYVFFNKQRKRWNAQYQEYDATTGTSSPRTKSFKTEEEARKYLATIMYQKENPVYIENHGIPICEVMKANLKLKLDTNQITPTQFGRVTRTIELIEKTPIGSKNIDEITSDELQNYMNAQIHLSNSSISKIYQQFNQTFKIAINKGYLMRNPMINVIKPKSVKEDKEVRALTVEEQQALTDYLLSKDQTKWDMIVQDDLITGKSQWIKFFAPNSTSSIVINKHKFLEIGGNDERFVGHGYEDFDLLARILHSCVKFEKMPKNLLYDSRNWNFKDYKPVFIMKIYVSSFKNRRKGCLYEERNNCRNFHRNDERGNRNRKNQR